MDTRRTLKRKRLRRAGKTNHPCKWAALYKQNRESLKQFDAAERSPIAKAFNMGKTFFAARKDGQNMPNSFMAASMPAERRLYVEKANQQRETTQRGLWETRQRGCHRV